MKKSLSLALSLLLLSFAVPAQASANTPSTIDMTVVFKNNSVNNSVKDAIVNSGGKIISEIPEVGTIEIQGKSTLLGTLKNYPDVLAVSPAITFKAPQVKSSDLNTADVNTTNADLYDSYQWDIKQVTNNRASYDRNMGSHNTVVGIIDSGISTKHDALKVNLLGGRNFVPDGPNGIIDPDDIEDRGGHGSHVAGTIAANGLIKGIAPNIGVRSYRIFGAEDGATSDRIVKAIIAATDDKVDVISMSIGGYDTKSQWIYTDPVTGEIQKGSDVADFLSYQRAIKYAVDNGVVVIAAAGNEAINCTNKRSITDYLNSEYGSYGYKFIGASFEVVGSIPGVITVSATGPDKTLASYSNYGPGFVDITAPGGDFKRYGKDADWYTDMCYSTYKDGGYRWLAGTSMATPKVSAVAALVVDKYKANGIKLSPNEVANILSKKSVDIGKPGEDEFFGKGMVNAYNALE